MIDNRAFALTDEELVRYNEWATKIATAMGEGEVESWTLSVSFNFSNLGTSIIAYVLDSDRRIDLIIRDELDMW